MCIPYRYIGEMSVAFHYWNLRIDWSHFEDRKLFYGRNDKEMKREIVEK